MGNVESTSSEVYHILVSTFYYCAAEITKSAKMKNSKIPIEL